ncbi:MAG TPA: M20/M25/M40 family metallo-hydrolase, partial [Symbiobacteriaceae bacterium]|nr:M20/M25/M40 family metallo-hydrolase [Symbiobacteriaceae bacterium]
NKERILKTFMELVTTDSATKQEGKIAALLKAKLEALGFTVEFDDAGKIIGGEVGNLIAKLPGTAGTKPLLLCSHMDRVTPGFGIKPVIRDGVIYSDGTTILASDDCTGLSAILEGVQTAIEQNLPRPDLEVVLTIAEEGGLNGSKNLDYSRIKATEAYIIDSGTPVGSLITKAPAQTKFTYKIVGKAAHGGVAPEKGINALYVAAAAIGKMKLGRIDHETTANIGIAAGGTATNAVMESFEIKGDARSLVVEKMNAQVAHMTQVLEETCAQFGAKLEKEILFSYGSVNLQPGSEALERASAAVRRLGMEPQYMATGGGADANLFNTKGINATDLGCGYSNPHGLDEFQPIDQLEKTGDLVVALIEEYASR